MYRVMAASKLSCVFVMQQRQYKCSSFSFSLSTSTLRSHQAFVLVSQDYWRNHKTNENCPLWDNRTSLNVLAMICTCHSVALNVTFYATHSSYFYVLTILSECLFWRWSCSCLRWPMASIPLEMQQRVPSFLLSVDGENYCDWISFSACGPGKRVY